MQLTCSKELLLDKLQLVLKTATTKSTMPVLSGILLKTKSSDSVELASTDMELSLRMVLQAQVEGEGSVVVPGRLLTDVVRSLPAGNVQIRFDNQDQVAEVTSGPANFRINCLPASDFPRLPEMPETGVFEVEAKPLVETIDTVARAASRDETRPVLTGILVKFNKDKIKMVATDSYRLCVRETATESSLTEKKEVIVPRASLEDLVKLYATRQSEKIKVGIIDGQIIFAIDDVILASRLIEGQFPNYQQLLPDSFKHEIALEKDEFLEVVARIGLMAQKSAPLRLKFSEGNLGVSAQTPQVGEAKEDLPVSFRGEELEIGFNPDFLRDGINSVKEKEVFLRIISPLRPGLVKSSDDDFLYLVMPVRLT